MKIFAVNAVHEYMGYRMDHRYAFQNKYDEQVLEKCKQLKVKYGWREFSWTPEATGTLPDGTTVKLEKVWRFSNPKIGLEIWEMFRHCEVTPDCGEIYARVRATEEAEAIRRKAMAEAFISSARDIVVLDHNNQPIPLMDYQKAVIKFCEITNGHALIALPPGAGKTLCSLAYLRRRGVSKVLVACPATVKIVWEKEITKWLGAKTYIIDAKHRLDRQAFDSHDFFVINYEVLEKNKKLINCFEFGAVVFDESSRIKSKKAQMTKAAIQVSESIDVQLGLNGTPVMNRFDELWSQIQVVNKNYFGDEKDFKKKFCGATLVPYDEEVKDEKGKVIKTVKKKRWSYGSEQNTAELRDLLASVVIHYLKDEILGELPPKIWSDIPVTPDPALMAEYRRVEEDFVEWLNENRPKIDPKTGLEKPRTNACIFEEINILRQLTSNMKVDAVMERLEMNQDAEAKSIVFSVYNAPLNDLKAKTGSASVLLVGSTPMDDRLKAIDSFQDGDKTVFLGGTLSAGVGITLTAASEVLFLDFAWSPELHTQAEDRAHRKGSAHESINISSFYVPGTIDDRMMEILAIKKRKIASLFGSASNGGGDKIDIRMALVNSYRKNNNNGDEPF